METINRFCPVPPSEQGLITHQADYFLKICEGPRKHVEGLCFDRQGRLYVCLTWECRVIRIDMDTLEKTEVFSRDGVYPVAVKIHKDGRLFICSVSHGAPAGITVMDPDGGNMFELVTGQDVDDIVFDSDGGFYYTNITGTNADPTGIVYYVDPSLERIEPFIEHLAMPNGVALSLDERTLWVTELSGGRLCRFPSKKGGSYNSVCYYFTGSVGPDSCTIDADDNLYVAMFGQGRVMVFNPMGYPVAQVLLPNRDIGHNLCSSHCVVRPGTRELYICSGDDIGEEGSWIFRAEAFGEGNGKAYQFM